MNIAHILGNTAVVHKYFAVTSQERIHLLFGMETQQVFLPNQDVEVLVEVEGILLKLASANFPALYIGDEPPHIQVYLLGSYNQSFIDFSLTVSGLRKNGIHHWTRILNLAVNKALQDH